MKDITMKNKIVASVALACVMSLGAAGVASAQSYSYSYTNNGSASASATATSSNGTTTTSTFCAVNGEEVPCDTAAAPAADYSYNYTPRSFSYSRWGR